MKNLNTVQGATALPAHVKSIKRVGAYAVLAMLGAYTVQLMNSAGAMGAQEKILTFASTLTLLVVIPIIALSVYFTARSRAARNAPKRTQAIKKELMAWAVPIAIVAVLSVLGWGVSHALIAASGPLAP